MIYELLINNYIELDSEFLKSLSYLILLNVTG